MHIIECETSEPEYPFNNSTNLIPVKNGVLKINFTSGNVTLLDDSPEHRFTYKLPVIFNPDANPSEIRKYLESLGCDIDFLTQIPAQGLLSMLGRNYKKSYLCIGEKNSGKTTFLDMLNEQFFGTSNCANIPLNELMNDRFKASGLVGKLINIADELGRPQGRQELRVARSAGRVPVQRVGARLPHGLGEIDHVVHGHLDGLLLGGARLGDAALRQQLRPVVAGPVRLGVQAQIGHHAVLAGYREEKLASCSCCAS